MSTPAAPCSFQRSRLASRVATGLATVTSREQTNLGPSLRRARRAFWRVMAAGWRPSPASFIASLTRIRFAGTERGVESAAETGDEDGVGLLFAQEVGEGVFAGLTRARDLAGGADRARLARRGRHDEEAHELPRPPSVPSAARTPSRGLAMVAPTAVAS